MQTISDRPLTLPNVLADIHRHIQSLLPRQIADPADPQHGALQTLDMGLCDGHQIFPFIFATGLLYITDRLNPAPQPLPPSQIAAPLEHAIAFLKRIQRPTGRFDLLSANYDSEPDTAFIVQALCCLLQIAQPLEKSDPTWSSLSTQLKTIIQSAARGLLTAGFHTPNHRWVICSALAQAQKIVPLESKPIIDALLAEGIDIDAEGFFIERSVAIYDAVNTRSLLLLSENYPVPAALPAVIKCLKTNLHLLHADATAETGLSRRQDYGSRIVPTFIASSYLHAGILSADPALQSAAQILYQSSTTTQLIDLSWLAYVLLRLGQPAIPSLPLPSNFSHPFPLNGMWCLRQNLLSASCFTRTTRIAHLCFGQAELAALKISHSYFGTGNFAAESMTVQPNGITLHNSGRRSPTRPGYDLPLNLPVPPEKWTDTLPLRSARPIPAIEGELSITQSPHLLTFRYRTLAGLDRVTSQIAFDFAPGGIWETNDSKFHPAPGQILFLKSGFGRMRYGNDVIQIGPGLHAHSTWALRDAEGPLGQVRILFTFLTPADITFTIHAFRGLSPSGDAHVST